MKFEPVVVHAAAAYQGPAETVVEDIEQRIVALEAIDLFLREKHRNAQRDEEVYNAQIRPGLEVWRMLYENQTLFSDDVRKILAGILDRAKSFEAQHPENRPLAQIGLWRDGERFIEEKNDWYRFRRETLHQCGVTQSSFFEQIKLIFPQFKFSIGFPNCLGSLEGDLSGFLPTIIRALDSLHEQLKPTLGKQPIVEGLKQFTAVSGFETTMEGSAERNSALTFSFKADNGDVQKIVCAPHMKLSSSGVPGDTKHYFNRIYFNPYQADEESQVIYIGHVGGHL
jgi:hypothetical protein